MKAMTSVRRSVLRGSFSRLLVLSLIACISYAYPAVAAPPYATVHNFPDPIVASPPDGERPVGALVQDAKGYFYGTTRYGGKYGQGTVFVMDPNFGVKILHHFQGPDGQTPTCTLILRPGKATTDLPFLYGTTLRGGRGKVGVVFRLHTDGTGYVVLHHFLGGPNDGANPFAGVILATDKRLYGTTLAGGTKSLGTVYRLSTAGGATTILHHFTGLTFGVDGARPYARLLQVDSRSMVGTTFLGGDANKGTVFRITLSGATYAIIHTFVGGDGANPAAELIFAADATGAKRLLYGTALNGGKDDYGTAYRLTVSGGSFGIVYNFGAGGPLDAMNPFGALVQAKNGKLYGATLNGGDNNLGAVYQLFPMVASPIAIGHSFAGALIVPEDGAHPFAALIQSLLDGTLLGTTFDEGVNGDGTVYQIGLF